jgi:hypothetical protein
MFGLVDAPADLPKPVFLYLPVRLTAPFRFIFVFWNGFWQARPVVYF